MCWTLRCNFSCKSLEGVCLNFFPPKVIMSKPLDLIIAVMEEKKMLLTVIMAIMVMEVRIPNATVFIATAKIALEGNTTFIQCTVLWCAAWNIFFQMANIFQFWMRISREQETLIRVRVHGCTAEKCHSYTLKVSFSTVNLIYSYF